MMHEDDIWQALREAQAKITQLEDAIAAGRAESQAEIDRLKRVIHAFEVGIGGLAMAIGEIGRGVKKANQ